MSEFAASANLDWAWIEFVGLGLLVPLIVVASSTALLGYWGKRHHR